MTIQAVFFDVGETLIDETRLWKRWARYLGVSFETFSAAFDEAIVRGAHHRTVFEHFRPGLDIEAVRRQWSASGDPDMFDTRDLYPEARSCLQDLRSQGFLVGIAGNQPKDAAMALTRLGFDPDVIASSSDWGVAKPDPDFFTKIAEAAGMPAAAIAYVGDRLDNDVVPARDAGMVAIFIERGPWGRVHAQHPDIVRAHGVVQSLDEVAGMLSDLNTLPA